MHHQRLTVGVIADTHGLLRPQAVAALRGSDLIVHAGDVGSPEILDELRALAPAFSVNGKVDRGAWAESGEPGADEGGPGSSSPAMSGAPPGLAQAVRDRGDRPEGQEIRFRCPYPDRYRNGDANPSARYHPERQVWRCDAPAKGGRWRDLRRPLDGVLPRSTRRRSEVAARYESATSRALTCGGRSGRSGDSRPPDLPPF